MKFYYLLICISFFFFITHAQTNQNTSNQTNLTNTSLIPQSFQDQLAIFLLQLQTINSTTGMDLANQLKVSVFQLYILLVDYHSNGPTTYQQINTKVIQLLRIIDKIVVMLRSSTNNNVVTGNNNTNYGSGNNLNGQNNTAVGILNTASGNNNTVIGILGSANGSNNTVTGSNQFVVGSNLNVSGANNVILIGRNLTNGSNILQVGNFSLDIVAAGKGKNSILNSKN